METRPGAISYHTATKAVLHGAPCTEDGVAGVAIKQQVAPAGTGLGSVLINQVQVAEKFAIQKRGRVYVDNLIGAVKGNPIYIIAATNLLTLTVGANIKFGRCMEVAGERGVGTGKMRVDLDDRDSF